MIESVRAKFRLTRIEKHQYQKGGVERCTYVFTTQYDKSIPEDHRFAEATPNGELKIVIDNPAAQQFFALGEDYYFNATGA